jgi:hypothetical protein
MIDFIAKWLLFGFGLLITTLGFLLILSFFRIKKTKETVAIERFTFRVTVLKGKQAQVIGKDDLRWGLFYLVMGLFTMVAGIYLALSR